MRKVLVIALLIGAAFMANQCVSFVQRAKAAHVDQISQVTE